MKIILCGNCGDTFSPNFLFMRSCLCNHTWGQFIDGTLKVSPSPFCKVLALDDDSLVQSMDNNGATPILATIVPPTCKDVTNRVQ